MLLSIIIPVYNKEEKIVRCLDSLRTIEASDIEVIIVNDGSTDNTKSVCQKYLNLDSRFRLINQDNAGVSSARNTGLDYSKGKYVGFVDADDEITSDYNKVVEVLRTEAYELYGFDYCVQKKNKLTICKKPLLKKGCNGRNVLYNSFLTGLSNSVWSNIYCLSVIRKHQIRFTLGMTMGEDCEFNSLYLRHCNEIYYTAEVAYKYYADDGSSATHQRRLNYLKDFERMYQAFLAIYQLEKNLEFPFDYELYMNFVYGILKKNVSIMTKEQNKEFRSSTFYKVLTSRRYKDRKINLKKLYVKWNLYRILG